MMYLKASLKKKKKYYHTKEYIIQKYVSLNNYIDDTLFIEKKSEKRR